MKRLPLKIDLGLVLTLLIVLIVGIVLMPAEECPGDAMAVRIETVHILQNGSFGVSAETATKYWGERGMFFDENEITGKWYPKYGIMNTLIYLPALSVEKLVNGKIHQISSPLRLILLNLHNILLSLLCAASFYFLARLYTAHSLIAATFALVVIYTTFCWYYFRAQIFEIHTVLFLSWATYLFIRCYRSSCKNEDDKNRESEVILFLGGSLVGLLMLSKTVYVVIAALAFVGWFLIPDLKKSLFTKKAVIYFTPVVLAGVVILICNHWRFGSPFNTGYTQWAAESRPMSGDVLRGVTGYLFDTQWGVFSCFPILLVSLFYWRKFFQFYRVEASVILAIGLVLLLINACFINWRGLWSYGPRYLLPILPALSLPAIYLFEGVNAIRSKVIKSLCILALVIASLFAASLQELVNRMPFYAWYQLEGKLAHQHSRLLDWYIYATPFWQINKDILSYRAGKNSPINSVLSANEFTVARECIKNLKTNYYWFK
jgi:hypothetical protein